MTRQASIRHALGGLLALVAVSSLGGGYYGMSGAPGVPTEWLAGSPFTTYLVPGVILFFMVGGSFLCAAIAVLARSRYAPAAASFAAVVALVWIATQVAIIGPVSFLQPVVVAAALLVIVLTRRLRPA